MMKLIAPAAAAALLFASGCGGSVCSRAESLPDTMNKKLTSCTNVTFTSKLDSCDTKIAKCNGDDQAKMNKWFDCLEALPNCEAGKEDDWTSSTIACATNNLGGITQDCQSTITGQ